MQLLALIIAYLVSHSVSKPQRFRNFRWYQLWMQWLATVSVLSSSKALLVLSVFIPTFLLSIGLNAVVDSELSGLLVAVLVLSYCIGPDSLKEDVDNNTICPKCGIEKNCKTPILIKNMTQLSVYRWFGIFFWYLLLGIFGALLYRLVERHKHFSADDTDAQQSATQLLRILNYPVAWMMVVSMAIASDFERIFKKCKGHMSVEKMKNLDDSFLYEAADFAVEICEVEDQDKNTIEQVSFSVLKRMLVVWLVFVAILVIFAS